MRGESPDSTQFNSMASSGHLRQDLDLGSGCTCLQQQARGRYAGAQQKLHRTGRWQLIALRLPRVPTGKITGRTWLDLSAVAPAWKNPGKVRSDSIHFGLSETGFSGGG